MDIALHSNLLTKEKGQQEGQRLVMENLLRVRFGIVDAELLGVVEAILQLPPEEYSRLLLELSREELLAWFGSGSN
jgi:hypothetical protein